MMYFKLSTENKELIIIIITAFLQFRPEGYREPRNEVGSLSPVERLVGF